MPELPDRAAVRAFTRRHRRPLAAASAGVAVLIALSAVSEPAPAPVAGPGTLPIQAGQVAISIALDTSSAHVVPGTAIDVVSVPDDGTPAHVVTRGGAVLDVTGASAFGSSSASVLLSVSEADALALADAAAHGSLTALIHSSAD